MPAPNINSDDYYAVLGVDRNADDNQLKKAYRKLAVKVRRRHWLMADLYVPVCTFRINESDILAVWNALTGRQIIECVINDELELELELELDLELDLDCRSLFLP